MSGVRKVQKVVYIDEDQLQALHAIKKKTLVPMNVVVRHGIDLAIKWYEEREEALERGLAFLEGEKK